MCGCGPTLARPISGWGKGKGGQEGRPRPIDELGRVGIGRGRTGVGLEGRPRLAHWSDRTWWDGAGQNGPIGPASS